MATARSDTAKNRAARWGLKVEHALYRKTGDWYHKLERFPGALLDENGYVVFETKDAFESCAWIRINQDVGVPNGGIKKIPGYIWVSDESGVVPETTTYEQELFREGTRVDIVQSRPERDAAARSACLAEHGYSCSACGFNFGIFYGSIGVRFIHVHHLSPIAEGKREVNPVQDLRPLCPNCHSMAHKRNPPFSIEELQIFIDQNGT